VGREMGNWCFLALRLGLLTHDVVAHTCILGRALLAFPGALTAKLDVHRGVHQLVDHARIHRLWADIAPHQSDE